MVLIPLLRKKNPACIVELGSLSDYLLRRSAMLIESNKSIKTKIRVFDFMATDLGLKLIKAKHAVNDESYRKKIL